MASPGHDPSGSGKSAGIKIDSSLIKTASSDVQQELSGLGVSVYSQEEFEAGVLHQIDQEVGRRNAEQQKKFVLKEYGTIKQEISTVRTELTSVSKRIASLLSQPLCDVVLRLRELRTSQELKRKQLQSLEAREQHLLKKLSGREEEDKGFGESSGESTSKDIAFGIPMTGQSSEQQRLIQMGHMTPFGGSVGETVIPQLEERGAPPNDVPSDGVGTGSSVVASSSEHVGDREKTEEGERQKQSSGIQLCSEGFDGLFSDPPLPLVKRKSPPQADKGKGKGKGKGKEKAKSGAAQKSSSLPTQPKAPELEGLLHDVTGVAPHSQQAGTGDFPSTESPSLEDGDADVYHPHLEGLEDSSDSDISEYFTDEELGGAGRGNRKKLRDLSSDDSDDDLILANRRKKRKWKANRRVRRYQDDGDEELYRMRIRQSVEASEPTEPDMQFSGGLKIPGSIWHKLYRYQQTGVKWLWELHCQHAGGIVGDEMGLGKTIQMIAFLAGLKVSNLRSHVTRKLGLGPVLIVCPATVMHQWVSEFHTWWAPFRVVVLHDTGTFMGDKRVLVDRIASDSGVLITTYAGIRLYRDLLLGCRWDYLILDEGHKIRNPDAEITLACKQFATPHRLILSGSPMQNNLRELWSLFDFAFPGKLGTLPVFMEQFSVPITLGGYANATQVQVETAYRCACVLRDTINPYLLRRLKADVKLQLPNKNEQVLFCRLTDYQREVYEDFLRSPEVEAMLVGRKQVFSGLMTLRKLCNHPDLVTNDYCELRKLCNGEEEDGGEGGSFTTIEVSKEKRKKRKSAASLAAAAAAADDEESYGYWRRSGKLEVVESLLKLWKSQGHRVLLFSQSKQMLHILETFVASRGYSYQKMDGSTTISSRQPLICKFNEDPSIFIFLLTTRVGGLGVNLTGANRVIIYDPDWNPSTDTQARERAWRIGQTRQVTIYRLLTAGTIEEKIYHRQIFKQFLTNRVLKDPRQRRFFKANDLYELFTLSSSDKDSSTETSAIFAGTGSEVVPKRKPRSPEKSRDRHRSERISLAGSKRKSHDNTPTPEKKRKKSHDTNLSKQTVSLEAEEWNWDQTTSDGLPLTETTLPKDPNELQLLSREGSQRPAGSSPGSGQPQSPQSQPGNEAQSEASDPVSGSPQPAPAAGGTESRPTLDGKELEPILNGMELGPSLDSGSSSPGIEFNHLSLKKKHKHKKKKKKKTSKGEQTSKRKHRNLVVDGEEIVGLERTGIFNPGGGDEEDLNEKQDDYIIRKLFKKTGIHSALQHDNIMSSADPDYILVESEAKKVAQSASKALRDSRRRCRTARPGQPTWTGQHGSAGAPKPRFGPGTKGQGLASGKQADSSSHFDGRVPGAGSLSTSSSVLLARMRSRNAHSLPEGASGLHRTTHSDLLQEVRDFIATRCKVDGQATTSEILGQFTSRLSPSENAVFRSMLHEICDFSRHGGEGLWFLKQEFR